MAKAKHPDTLGYNKEIGKKVREMSATVNVADIFAEVQRFQSAPRSMHTFYKYYRSDLIAGKNGVVQAIGDKVINTALTGDEDNPATHKSREFYLRSKGGWTPKEGIETREVGTEEEETESAVEALMAALGKEVKEED